MPYLERDREYTSKLLHYFYLVSIVARVWVIDQEVSVSCLAFVLPLQTAQKKKRLSEACLRKIVLINIRLCLTLS